jgi:hypothetical protein
MRRLIASEFLKARTTRAPWVLLLVVSALVALFTSLGIALHEGQWREDEILDIVQTPGGITSLFVLLVGVVGFTGEFRHGTIAQTLLVTPRRERVLAAKLGAFALVGLAYAAATIALMLAMSYPWFRLLDVDVPWAHAPYRSVILGGLLASAIWAPIGVAVGGAIRNQIGGVVGALLWLLVIENILYGFFPDEAKYLPGRAGDAIHSDTVDHTLSRGGGVLVLLGWLVLFSLVAAVLLRERDVT